jgi:hypothetical protein
VELTQKWPQVGTEIPMARVGPYRADGPGGAIMMVSAQSDDGAGYDPCMAVSVVVSPSLTNKQR